MGKRQSIQQELLGNLDSCMQINETRTHPHTMHENKLKYPSTDDWIRKIWNIYTMEYYSAIKKNEIMPFAITWMELETLILSEVSQKEKDKYHMTI